MLRRRRLTSLPDHLLLSLLLVERGYFFLNGKDLARGMLPKKVLDLINRLDEAEVDWVLVGAEAINLYLKSPRATVDVDLVVRKKDLRKAKKILKETCVEVKDSEVHLTGLLSPPPLRLNVDLIKSQSHGLFEEALDRKLDMEGVKAPPVEILLALKYLSASSPSRRRDDKMQDLVDFLRAYRDNRSRIDRALLIDLASRAYRNARKDFEKFLDDVDHDRPITV